jgi:aspartyl-tRNA synthetase
VDTPVSIEDLLFERESEFSKEDFLELNVNNEELVNLASTAVNSLFETVSSLDPQFDVLSIQYALSYTTLEFLFIFDTGEG